MAAVVSEERHAAEGMRHALNNFPCACIHEFPYAPRGKLVKQCARCKSLAAWEAASKSAEVKS